ncbi:MULTISPECIES: phosphotransferase [unclassified Caulobacter]|uniref:phosphotransferase n=1 Tax=unclassified Caulobacter TaxID=2648921 RepID=UPI0018EB8F59|nr:MULTISPECIES: phosphotransferase [unclassified Caulobacter]
MAAPSSSDRPYPAREGRLPRHLEEVTAPWLTGLMSHRYPGLVVEAAKIVEVRNGHTTKLRLELQLNAVGRAAGVPRQVCLKSNWSEGFESGNICELEARFYYFMREQLSAPVVRSYYADWDGDGGGRGLVIMEDLGASPGQFGHSSHHLGVDGVAKALESLAILHGALWDSPQLDEQAWLHASMDTPVDTDQLLRMYNYIGLNLPKPEYRAVLPHWLYETPELFSHAYDELAAFERAQTTPRCLVHGDAHQGNSFLRTDGERVWHDWQLVRKGRPWRDVTYLMLGALTVEERRRWDRDLVTHYCEALTATGARGVLAKDAAFEQVRRWPVYGAQAWLANVDQWGQGGLAMVERFFSAMEDYGTIEGLTRGKAPRRQVKLGEGAREIASGLRALL